MGIKIPFVFAQYARVSLSSFYVCAYEIKILRRGIILNVSGKNDDSFLARHDVQLKKNIKSKITDNRGERERETRRSSFKVQESPEIGEKKDSTRGGLSNDAGGRIRFRSGSEEL